VVIGLSEGHAAVMKAMRDGQGLQTMSVRAIRV
jgi:hypothetical protein